MTQEWAKHTQGLPRGRFVRVPHDCGPGKTLRVEHHTDGSYHAYCFRCGPQGFIPRPELSVSEKIAELNAKRDIELQQRASVDLPQPAEHNVQQWPLHARVWLYKAGLSNDDIERLGAYYVQPIDRVVLPVRDAEGKVVYWQARGFAKGFAKYINPEVDRNNLVAQYGSGPVLVLTEDILSAYVTARVTQAWSLLGTKLPDGVAALIARQEKPVIMMLDPDKAGEQGRAKVKRSLAAMGVEVYVAKPSRDPKYFTRKEIIACLMEALPSTHATQSQLSALYGSSRW